MKKTISIVLAVFNEAEYIEEALWSILAPYEALKGGFGYELELIVVDDFSTDSTAHLLSKIRHPALRVIANREKGKVSAYNLGLKSAAGEFIILFSGDDRFNFDALCSRVLPIENAIGPAVSFCALQAFRGDDGLLLRRYPRVGGGARAGGALAMNRAFLELCHPIPDGLPNEDSWLCLHADYLATVYHVDDIGVWYRIHEGNTSCRTSSNSRCYREAILDRSKVYSLFLDSCSDKLSEDQRLLLLREIAAHTLARSRNLLSICVLSGYPLFRRLRAACLSSPWLWHLRTRFFD